MRWKLPRTVLLFCKTVIFESISSLQHSKRPHLKKTYALLGFCCPLHFLPAYVEM